MIAFARKRIKAWCPASALAAVRASRRMWRRVRAYPRVATCDVRGVRIRLRISTELELHRATTYTTKEPETIEWLRTQLRHDDVLFDVGANVGLYSLYAAALQPAARIYAFEPHVQNFSRLCENMQLNGFTNITPCCFPLSDDDAYATFNVYDTRPGSALHSLTALNDWRGSGKDLVQIRQGTLSVSIDTLVQRHGLPAPTLLKIDVDGIEPQILAGARALLASGRIRSVLVEVTENADRQGQTWAEQVLSEHGYRFTDVNAREFIVNGLKSRNCIFTRAIA